MPEVEVKVEKVNAVEYFACKKCEKKLGILEVSGGTGGDLFGFSAGKTKLLYCDNKECEKFGDLTIVGVKKRQE